MQRCIIFLQISHVNVCRNGNKVVILHIRIENADMSASTYYRLLIMNKRRTSLKDLAARLGVSIATVSRALRNSHEVGDEMKEKVQALAKEMNYRPNPFAQSLRKEAPRIIGVVVPNLVTHYYAAVLDGVEDFAVKNGYSVISANSHENHELEARAIDNFINLHVEGIIACLAQDTVDYSHFKEIHDMGIPLVFFDRICTGINTSRVVVDDYMGAMTAVNYLIETGCRRIAFFGSSMKLEISKNRYNGYHDALTRHGLTVDDRYIRFCDNRADAEVVAPELLKMADRPDAFFAVNDDTAIGILYTAKRMGLRVPEDVSICGFTNGERAIACDPMLTTVEQRGNKVGREAAAILIAQSEGDIPLGKVEKRVVRTRLIVRGTTRVLPGDNMTK